MYWAAMYPLHLDRRLPHYICGLGLFVECFFELFLYLVSIHIAILYVCTIYFNYDSGDLELLVNCMIQTIIYVWTIVMKVYFRRLRPHHLEGMVDTINVEYRTRSAIGKAGNECNACGCCCSTRWLLFLSLLFAGFTYVTMDQCLDMSNRWIKTYVYCCFIGTVFWLLLPIAYGDRSLPLACWYPLDYKVCTHTDIHAHMCDNI